MRQKLFLLLMLLATMPALAQKAGLTGVVVDANTGAPVSGASVMLNEQGAFVTTGPSGDFIISDLAAGKEIMTIVAFGYNDLVKEIELFNNQTIDLGKISFVPADANVINENQELLIDQTMLEEDEESNQTIGALMGASDNVYFSTAAYDFGPMYFRVRGYNSEYQTTYMNGIALNDLGRGRFSYSTLGGMTSRAFRNKTTVMGLGAATYGFGDVGGAVNFNTMAADYAPGFNGSISYTNSNYKMRAMATYSTGLNKHGWAFTASAIGRYADEGEQPGTFYNSWGYFLALQKVFNPQHSIAITTYGAPTQRGTASATFEEAYELADDNLYNPNWGWQDGKKRNARIVETFDPTTIINWLWKPNKGTTLNTAAGIRWINYNKSDLNWSGNAANPKPDYYRNLPSFFKDDQEAFDLYTDLWRNSEEMRQINWDEMYQANYLNNEHNRVPGNTPLGSSYIVENRHSNQFNALFNSMLNHRINNIMSLQAGISFNYTKASYFKTVRDLLGGEYWLDVDKFAERDFPDNPQMLQNDLNNPNRKVQKGDRFGYDYDIYAVKANAWIQNMITLPQWDINYGFNVSYTQFFRDGNMRNGHAPDNSYGKGETHRFDNAGFKAGATYKLDGHNFFTVNGLYETRAPLFEYAYISPRIKDDAIDGLQNERILSGDISYNWNYRRFRGNITGFWTEMWDQTERTAFYDDQYESFMNYVLKGVHKTYKGVEIGMAYKITPDVTVTAAGTYSRYQYKNRPTGVRSYENGMLPDTTTTVYLRNFYVGGTPQTAANIGIDWAAPKNWYFNVNATWAGDAYVNLSPVRHEAMPNLWEKYPSYETLEGKMNELAVQDKLKDAFVLNASIGKVFYLNRKVSLNANININNILNNRNIQTYGYQQSRMDVTNYDVTKYPNKISYSQGIKIFANLGIRF